MAPLCGADETTPYPRRFYACYPETKALAEQRVLAAHDAAGLLTCALRPHLIYGPRDNHIVPMLVAKARAGQLVQVGDGQNLVDVTYVENAAAAHLQAAAALHAGSPVGGRAYFLSDGEPVHLWAFVNRLLTGMGLDPVRRRIGYRTAYALAAVLETVHRALPVLGEPRLTRFTACNFAQSHYFSLARARADFGYQPPVPQAEGVARTLAYFAPRVAAGRL
jgi:nucleoside-diphosphate-sugar epimerase